MPTYPKVSELELLLLLLQLQLSADFSTHVLSTACSMDTRRGGPARSLAVAHIFMRS